MPKIGAKAPRLLVDAMLGNLARRLRWLGYDTAFLRDFPDEAMMRIAGEEDRLLVTRDRALAGRRGVRALYVSAQNVADQVHEVTEAIGPSFHPPRCTVCNGVLVAISVEEATSLVPAYVAQTQTRFMRCTQCGRVYWPGSHWPGLQQWREDDAASS